MGRRNVPVTRIGLRNIINSIFFFKQKTAYEMLRSLVGSEMCIRDRCITFEETLERIEEEDKYAHEEDEEEAGGGNDGSKKRPRDEDWSSEYN